MKKKRTAQTVVVRSAQSTRGRSGSAKVGSGASANAARSRLDTYRSSSGAMVRPDAEGAGLAAAGSDNASARGYQNLHAQRYSVGGSFMAPYVKGTGVKEKKVVARNSRKRVFGL